MFRRMSTAIALVSLMGSAAAASGIDLSNQQFDVSIRDQSVRDVFKEISAVIDVPILLSEAVSGRVSVSFQDATAEDMLDGLAREGALDWRMDGNRIRITSRSEQTTRIVDLDGVTLASLRESLTALGVYEDDFRMTAVDGEFGMIVAPPDYIALVEVVLGALIERHAKDEAERIEDEKQRREFDLRAAEQRLEFERLERAADLERVRLENQRARELEQDRELRARRGPQLIRNGVWGG